MVVTLIRYWRTFFDRINAISYHALRRHNTKLLTSLSFPRLERMLSTSPVTSLPAAAGIFDLGAHSRMPNASVAFRLCTPTTLFAIGARAMTTFARSKRSPTWDWCWARWSMTKRVKSSTELFDQREEPDGDLIVWRREGTMLVCAIREAAC